MSTALEKRLGTLAQAQYDKYRWLREAGGHHGGAVHVLCAAFAVCERGRRQCQVSHRRLHGPRRGAVRAEDARHFAEQPGPRCLHLPVRRHAPLVPLALRHRDGSGRGQQRQHLRTMGGNESDSVGMKEVRLDAKGLVKSPGGLYMSVIETLV